jgi:hypothetical protein
MKKKRKPRIDRTKSEDKPEGDSDKHSSNSKKKL